MSAVRCRALGDARVLLPCVPGELLVFVATLAGRKDAPVGAPWNYCIPQQPGHRVILSFDLGSALSQCLV